MDPNVRIKTDEALLESYRAGDVGALRSLVERYQDELFRFLYRLSGDRQTAEDAFQEAFLQVHLSVDTFDPERRFRPWLFTIAANKARDLLRKKARRHALDLSSPLGNSSEDAGTFIDLLEVDVPAPDDAFDARERDAMVQEAMSKMPLPLREILLLAYFQRLSYVQISDDLQIPLGTVKSRLHAAVASFAKQWKLITDAQR